MPRPIYVLAGLLLICGCEQAVPVADALVVPDEPDDRVLELFGGQAGWKPLVEHQRVEAFRIDSSQHAAPGEAETGSEKPQFVGYPIISGPVAVDADTARQFARLLADPDAYGWDYAKGCTFEPGVGIRFVGAEDTTEILFCFYCDELEIVVGGKRVGHEDTDAIRTPLVQAVQKIFPDDAIIQGLKTAEELEQIAAEQQRKRHQQIRQWGQPMPAAAVDALIEKDAEAFVSALTSGLPATADQIRALLHFEGGPNASWSSHEGVEVAVNDLLKSYPADELAGPVREALLGEDRLTRRGAARLWLGWHSPLEEWQPQDSPKLHDICLTVMQEARYYPTRQTAFTMLTKWAANLPSDEVDQRLEAGLHDPHPGVRRSAMLAAGRLGKEFAVPYLLKQLNGEEVETAPLPEVPPEEQSDVPEGFDNVAGKRTEPEVAALALGWLGKKEAVELIENKQPPSPMYDVALALLGDLKRLKPEYFHLGERNKELQLAAVEAVVRAKGRVGLDMVVNYEQATHWWEEEYVVDQVTKMLLAEHAPGEAMLKDCSELKQLAAWYAQYGQEYLQRFSDSP